MTRAELHGQVVAALMLAAFGVCLYGLVSLAAEVIRPLHRPTLAPVVTYCPEPHAPGTLATFASCRTVIRDSVWPL